MKAVRVSPMRRLKALPEVFDLRDLELALADLEPEKAEIRRLAANYAWRWKQAGLVEAAGPKLGLFFNLVRDPSGPTARLAEAVAKALGVAGVVVGAGALHWAGWTTQRPHRLEVAVPVTERKRSLPEFAGLDLCARTPGWFARTAGATEDGPDGFRVLKPAFALVDAAASPADPTYGKPVWRPDPDDLDLPEDAAEAIEEALAAMAPRGEVAAEVRGTYGTASAYGR